MQNIVFECKFIYKINIKCETLHVNWYFKKALHIEYYIGIKLI